MTMKTIDDTIRNLERLIDQTGRAEQIYATHRLRRVIAAVEPQSVPDALGADADDDMMFDNMPV